jgi:hypothetical protein
MTASHLLALCFVLTAYGFDLGPPPWICSAPEALTNVCAYQTPQSTAKVNVGLAGFADRPVSPCRPLNYSQETSTPLVRLATSPRPPPRSTDAIDVQMNPDLCTDHADPTPNICSAEDESVLIRNEMIHPVSHYPDTSDMQDFMKRLTGDGPKKNCKDAKPKPLEPGQKLSSILFARKKPPQKICGYGPQLFYTMARTCTTPTTTAPAHHSNSPPPPPLSLCCELLYAMTLVLISMSLVVSTACVFGLAKAFDKLTGVKIPSCQTSLSPPPPRPLAAWWRCTDQA